MLITCNGCDSKIKVPDAAAGKRIKCPKCATIIRVPKPGEPELEAPEVAAKTPPPEPPPEEPEAETPDEEPEETAQTRVTASKSKASSSAVKSSRTKSRDEDEDEDDEPPGKGRRRDEDDDDDLDVRKRGGRKKGANNMATTSMIVGIVGLVVGLPGCIGCCCGIPTVIALACGITAVICGHMSSKSPGSEGNALTGLICGYVAIGLSLIGVVVTILSIFFNIGMQGMNMGGFNQPMFNPPPRIQPPPPPPVKFR